MPYRLTTFGTLHVVDENGRPVDLRRHARALLTILAAAGPGGVSRDTLHSLLWPESDSARAQNSLRQAVYHVRRELHADSIGGTSVLTLDGGIVHSDVQQFLDAIAAGRGEEAVALHAAPFLDGFYLRDSVEFERWVDAKRADFLRQTLAAAARVADRALASGEPAIAEDALRRAARLQPLDSRLAARLLRATIAANNPALALREGEAHLELLHSELELPPDPEVVELLDQLRANAARVPRARPSPAPPPVSRALDPAPDDDVPIVPLASAGIAVPVLPPVHGGRFQPAAVGVAVIALVGGLFALARVGQGSSSTPDEHLLVVTPFEVAGPSAMQFLGSGTARLIASGLDNFRGRHVVDPAAVQAYLESDKRRQADSAHSADAGDVARHFAAGEYISGGIIVHGDSVLVRAALHRRAPRDTVVAEAERDGPSRDVFRLADQLAATLAAATGVTTNLPLATSAMTTTSSLEAYKAFLEGEDAMRGWQFAPAVKAYERAVVLDSAFALAWYRLSIAADWLPNASLTREAADHALCNAGRLAEHERLLVESMEAWRHDRFDEAETKLRRVTMFWRTDADAWNQLGEVLFHSNTLRGRQAEEAREPFERLVALDPRNRDGKIHLARLEALAGHVAAADSILRPILAEIPDSASLDTRIFRAFLVRDAAMEERTLRELAPRPDIDVYTECNRTATYVHDLAGAERICSLLVAPGRSVLAQGMGHLMLAYLAMTQGERSRARAELARMPALTSAWAREERAYFECMPMFPVDSVRAREARDALAHFDAVAAEKGVVGGWFNQRHVGSRLYFLGRVHACLGDTAASTRFSAELARPARDSNATLFRHFVLSLEAQRDLAGGRGTAAVKALEAGFASHDPASEDLVALVVDRYLRGAALLEAGQAEQARDWFGSFEGNQLADLVMAAQGHLKRAEVARRSGDVASERAELSKFLGYWRAPDAELRRTVDSARTRLGALSAR